MTRRSSLQSRHSLLWKYDSALTWARINQRFHHGFEFSRFCYLDCRIPCAHNALYVRQNLPMRRHRIRNLFASQGPPFETSCIESGLTAVVLVSCGLAVGHRVCERDSGNLEHLDESRCRVAEHPVCISAAG